jgi:transposase
VDGSRVAVSSLDSLKGRAALEKLLAQVDAAITAMEQVNQSEDGPDGRTSRSPQALPSKWAMRERLQEALAALSKLEEATAQRQEHAAAAGAVAQIAGSSPNLSGNNQEGRPTVVAAPLEPAGEGPRISATDPQAVWIKGRNGLSLGYNGQVVVDGKAQIVVAADVVASSSDTNQLLPMLLEAEAMTGRRAVAVTADVAYFAMPDLEAVQRLGTEPYVPDRRQRRADGPEQNPYHKAHFVYDPDRDTYRCPLGQALHHCGTQRQGERTLHMYRGKACQGCPAQQSGECTKAKARRIKIYGHEQALQVHAAKMKTPAAQLILGRRKAIVEPVFAVFREHLGLLRFLLRGLDNVKAEWRLLSIAHNLRKLWKLWWRPKTLELAATN